MVVIGMGSMSVAVRWWWSIVISQHRIPLIIIIIIVLLEVYLPTGHRGAKGSGIGVKGSEVGNPHPYP